MVEATYYYIDDFTDETMPCSPTLEGWAEWLAAAPDEDESWGREGPEEFGTIYAASRVDLVTSVLVEGAGDGRAEDILIPAIPEEVTHVYVRFGRDLGWDPEMSAYRDLMGEGRTEADFLQDIRELCSPLKPGSALWLACCADRPRVLIRFDKDAAGRPVCIVEGAVQ